MASAFFPEKMKFLEFACPAPSAYYLVRELAEHGKVQLIDQHNGDFSQPKRHAETYMACEDAERSLAYIKQNLDKEDGLLGPPPTYDEAKRGISEMAFQETLQEIKEADASLREKMEIYQNLCTAYWQKKKKLKCLRFFKDTMKDQPEEEPPAESEAGALELSVINEMGIISVTGLVNTALLRKMFQTVWRATRRNVVTHSGVADGDVVPYTIVLASSSVLEKVQKICESFGPDVFVFRADPDELGHMEQELCAEIRQMVEVDAQTKETNKQFMSELAARYWQWRVFVTREKQIWLATDYGSFGEADDTVLYGGWCPSRFVDELGPRLVTAQQESGSPVGIEMRTVNPKQKESQTNPIPTYIERNGFNASFQALNDAYGVPNYDELNGGAFYGMYPFLFGVMFGDIGHAFFYLLAAFAMLAMHSLVQKKKMAPVMSDSMFAFKWLLFFAAISAMYCGLIYNECFGLPIYMTKSAWIQNQTHPSEWYRRPGYVYPFGIDPEWLFKDNELIFLNSYKMKLSVVMGMCQMIFGMFLQLIKHIYRKDVREIIVTWIPEMMYLVPFFGYLVVIIIVKWCTDWSTRPDQSDGVNLIQMMINMILSFGSKDATLELYTWQWGVQNIIVIIFFVSIPLLLFLKPICECIRLRGTEEFNVLEIFVMNLIHVIEFCLGALSHTASYLRLWALSLAHSQLSHVIYEQVFQMTLKTNNVALFWIGWAAFAALTAAILLGMEAFSALLHAIRLMWVEFSSKFYEGMGTPFKPLALRKALRPYGIN